MFKTLPSIVVVTRQTRMDELVRRRATAGFAKFAIGQARQREKAQLAQEFGQAADRQAVAAAVHDLDLAAGFQAYEDEGERYRQVIVRLKSELDLGLPVTFVDREYLPTFSFGRCVAVVVVGQDGLVANTAKYVGDLPILGVNPDPTRNDGILLPFHAHQARSALKKVLDNRAKVRQVSLAKVQLSDEQKMLAFNDFFIGMRGHASARYTLRCGLNAEAQSSSGVLVSTGAGSTGWMSSVFNMVRGVTGWYGEPSHVHAPLKWEDRQLVWAVREPFISKHSSANFVAGILNDGDELVIESLMPENGVIFSDGIESDFLEFSSGTVARISLARQQAKLVVG